MKLKELFERVTWNDLKIALAKEYPEQKKFLKGYERAFKEICKLKPKSKNPTENWNIIIEECEDWFDKVKYIHVGGICPEKKEDGVDADQSWSLMLTDWSEWLNMDIDQNKFKMGRVLTFTEMVAHILYEMTWMGFTNKKVMAENRKLN